MYVHSNIPEGEEIVYLEVVEDIKDNHGILARNFVISKGSITWIRKSRYATNLEYNILLIEDNRYQFNFHKDCFKEIPNPYEEKEIKKEGYKFSIGQEVQIRDDSEYSDQGRSIDGTKLKGVIFEYYVGGGDSEFKYRVRWPKNRRDVYRDEDLEPYQEPETKTKSKPHDFKVGDIVKIREDSTLASFGKDKDGNRKIGKILEIEGPNTCSLFTIYLKFSGSIHPEGFRLEDLEYCTEPYPEEEKKGIGKDSKKNGYPGKPEDTLPLSYKAITLDLKKEEQKLHPDVSRMKSI